MRNRFFLFLLLITGSIQAQHFKIAETPNWVINTDKEVVSQVSKYDVQSGAYSTKIDYQILFEEEADYSRFATKIVTQAGISTASEIYISYDSSYQYVEFHHLYIWRNGKKIDKTADLTFETLNNENELQNKIYSGRITAYDILEDIRLNDVIDYAYTIYGDNPIYYGKAFRLLPLEDVNPVDHLFVRAIFSKDNNITIQCETCDDSNLTEKVEGNNKIIEIERFNIEAGDYEETIPSWIIPYAHVVIHNKQNWQDISEWSYGIFQVENEEDLNVSAVFEEVLNGEENEEEKITKLLNYVQNEIRYMGIESGIGSIKPFPPKQVVNQRFGDCKDKSLLFSTLMKKIGVEDCYPALVNTSFQHEVSKYPASGYLFDHVIVYLKYKGKEYWIDPTISHQGGTFKSRMMPDYGKALIVKKGNKSFTDMNNIDEFSKAVTYENYNITSFEKPGTITITTKLYGRNADFMRSTLEYYSIKDVSEQFKNNYALVYPNILEAERLKIKDDLDSNIMTLIENYQISDYWFDSEGMFTLRNTYQYEPLGLYEYVTQLNCELKESPVGVGFPMNYEHYVTFSLPSKMNLEDADITYSNPAFEFRKTESLTNDTTLKVSYFYNSKTKEIKADEFPEVCKDMNNLVRDLPLQLYFPKGLIPKSDKKR